MAFADAHSNGVVSHISSGAAPAAITLSAAVSRGDPIGFSSGWRPALATVGSVVQIRCVASEDGVAGQTITAYFGDVKIGGGRFTGGTPGGALYVAEGATAGLYTQTAPSTTGDANKIVGYMLNTTEGIVVPNNNVDSIA